MVYRHYQGGRGGGTGANKPNFRNKISAFQVYINLHSLAQNLKMFRGSIPLPGPP